MGKLNLALGLVMAEGLYRVFDLYQMISNNTHMAWQRFLWGGWETCLGTTVLIGTFVAAGLLFSYQSNFNK